MVFVIALLLAFFMFMVFRTYRSARSVAIAAVGLFLLTTTVLVRGLIILTAEPAVAFFNQNLAPREFYHLMGGWYAADLLCTVLIIRRLRAYRNINTQPPRDPDQC